MLLASIAIAEDVYVYAKKILCFGCLHLFIFGYLFFSYGFSLI